MIIKKYEVAGMMEWHPVFKVGRSRLQVSFQGGHLCGGACTPAFYETSDPVVQAVIETSDAFKSKKIRIGMTRKILDEPNKPVELPKPNEPKELSKPKEPAKPVSPDKGGEVYEYEGLGDASDFLHYKKGVPIELLDTMDNCISEAKKLGITLKKKV